MARLLFELHPSAPLHLPLEIRGNVLRGAFGKVFQRSICDQDCPGTRNCPRREVCAYAMLFEPGWRNEGSNFGAGDAPRAFLFRPTQHPDPSFGSGQPLHFELRLFGQAIEVAQFFIHAFQSMMRQGLQGVRVHLHSVHTLDWKSASQGELVTEGKLTRSSPHTLTLADLHIPPCPQTPVQIHFLTPTLLNFNKSEQRIPTLEALICRLRDRLSFLSLLYEGCQWQADYSAIGKVAASARRLVHHGQWHSTQRHSSRTGQTMPLSGYRGSVVYEDVHPDLWPLLVYGQETHVGSHAVWGNGGYHIDVGQEWSAPSTR
jgi:hypothetical protein